MAPFILIVIHHFDFDKHGRTFVYCAPSQLKYITSINRAIHCIEGWRVIGHSIESSEIDDIFIYTDALIFNRMSGSFKLKKGKALTCRFFMCVKWSSYTHMSGQWNTFNFRYHLSIIDTRICFIVIALSSFVDLFGKVRA